MVKLLTSTSKFIISVLPSTRSIPLSLYGVSVKTTFIPLGPSESSVPSNPIQSLKFKLAVPVDGT